MWVVLETKAAVKGIAAAPPQVKAAYVAWLQIVRASGPQGLREVKGFHAEKLKGQNAGRNTCRLNGQWRIFYTIANDVLTVEVVDINPHDYR